MEAKVLTSDMRTTVLNASVEITVSPNISDEGIRYPDSLLDAAAVLFILFAVIGVTGNFISILALSRCPRLRNATTAFIINLCVADLIFCSFSSPLQAVAYIQRDWSFGGGLLCKLFPFVSYLNALVSLFTVLAIAINRYICVVHPLHYARIYRFWNVFAMILFFWMSLLFIMSLPLFGVWGKMAFDTHGGTCEILPVNGRSPKKIVFGAALSLPSITFMFCYARIYWVVRKASRKVQSDTSESVIREPHFRAYLNRNIDDTPDVLNVQRRKKELMVMKVALVIYITYVVCYFPVSVVKILRLDRRVPVLNVLGKLLAYLGQSVNPIIYIITSDAYRKAYFQLFSFRKDCSTSN